MVENYIKNHIERVGIKLIATRKATFDYGKPVRCLAVPNGQWH